MRVYGSPRGEGRLLGSLHREANPTLHPLPAARGKSQLLVAWEAPRSGRGTTPVWVDLIRQEGDGIGIAWSTADLFGGPVQTWQLRMTRPGGGPLALDERRVNPAERILAHRRLRGGQDPVLLEYCG